MMAHDEYSRAGREQDLRNERHGRDRDHFRDNDDVRDPIPPDQRNDTKPDTRSEARGEARENVGNVARGTAAHPREDGNDRSKHGGEKRTRD
jgi:hypothetical protein